MMTDQEDLAASEAVHERARFNREQLNAAKREAPKPIPTNWRPLRVSYEPGVFLPGRPLELDPALWFYFSVLPNTAVLVRAQGSWRAGRVRFDLRAQTRIPVEYRAANGSPVLRRVRPAAVRVFPPHI